MEQLDELPRLFRRNEGLAIFPLADCATHADDVGLEIEKQTRVLRFERTRECHAQPGFMSLVHKLSNLFQRERVE